MGLIHINRLDDWQMGGRLNDDERREESRRILEDVERDSQPLLFRSAANMRDHFTAREAHDQDWTERWGRRIGRMLALIFAVLLIFWVWSLISRGS